MSCPVRACLKNHFRNLQAPLCGIFYPHSVAVARYAALIRIKSPTNWNSQLTKSLFQTRSSKKYNVKSARQIRQWIHNYNEFGEEGLKRSRQKNNYSFEFKLHMVESYLSNEVSYEELALANGITNYTMISRWVEAFRVAGPDGLRPRKKGRKKTLDNSVYNKISQNVKENTPNTSAEHVKELEDELLKLRIENAFLKELRRLRLEDDAKMRERLESSVVSEDNSN